ncbi:AbfB domain-containing protein [Nonomuraea sp. NPDC050394]|uniref:AbfB domain-containing protein n=1 Tax=Nonomuraea sp. NPDC050394 TaxID=3364363 RepID=UPI00378AC4F7
MFIVKAAMAAVLLSVSTPATTSAPVLWSVMEASFPRGQCLRHSDFLLDLDFCPTWTRPLPMSQAGLVAEVARDPWKADFLFGNKPGLAGFGSHSYNSYNYPDHYIRHQNFRMRISKLPAAGAPDHVQFTKDASFYEWWPGIAGDAGEPLSSVSLQSYNFPTQFVRHSNYRFHLGDMRHERMTIRQDATFVHHLIHACLWC